MKHSNQYFPTPGVPDEEQGELLFSALWVLLGGVLGALAGLGVYHLVH